MQQQQQQQKPPQYQFQFQHQMQVLEPSSDHQNGFSQQQQQQQQNHHHQQSQLHSQLQQQSQSTPQLQTLQNRARSTSESQRTLRAEKRMGRLFRQQSSSAIHSSASTSLNQSISHTKQLSLDQIPLSTTSNTDQEDSLSPNEINHDVNGFVHSNNSSISSQVGSSTSTSTTPSISSNQTIRKFGFLNINTNNSINPTNNSGSTSTFASVSSPEIMSPNIHSNISLSTINSIDNTNNNSNTTNMNTLQQIDESKFKFRSDSSFSKLSTLQEDTNSNNSNSNNSNNNNSNSLDTLLLMSKKFVFFHKQFLIGLESLNIKNLNFSMTNFNVYLTVLETVEKKLFQKGHDQITNSMKAHLTLSLINSMSDLQKFIENLKLYFKSNNLDTPLSSLRMTYFNLFSLFLELTNICKIIIPFSHRSIISSSNNLRNNSINLKNKQNFIINRIPAPNPQLPSQTIITSNQNSFDGITNRQPSISRQYSKLDRQDSDLSIASNSIDSSIISTDELYDLIGYTVQAAHVVFNQMNNAIAKSAILVSENKTLDPNSQDFERQNNSNSNNNNNNNNLNNIVIKVKELTNQCLASIEQTKKVENCLLIVKKNNSNSSIELETQKNLYEQTNLFMKSIISILAATKMAIQDLPSLNDVRSSLSILTRATKELTIKLESSSLKQSVLNNVTSTTSLVDQPNLLSIPSMGNFNFDPQQIQSPTLESNNSNNNNNNIRRINKLRQIPEQNENMIGTMKQYIKNLEINTSDLIINQSQAPLSVTTPLIASIGPSVANAVLPIKSPLKTSSANLNSTFISSQHSNLTTIDGNLQNGSTTPLHNGNIQNEYNPFDRLITSRNTSGQ
ncbi:hypothetical protein C6P40_002449 [Pichia californica]|uniref:Uncharacterized protein n=1 Tax=Pichia californica TaxID=460514 RepID=A0A9P6WIF4_9ASCO|nr:hypothetical protein C6P40_002449 [[Candida] californica]